ncbi:heat-shock protein HtpX, partial [Micropruina sp.]|uniref:arsenate reductase/protein-tyrosine-phosphatase family protein n=1 Tax=Micropruina sp. TaxID=2737536 RepID=UPI003451059B
SRPTKEGSMAVNSVLFVCVSNAGRSQMAAGFLTQLSGGSIAVESAGTEPADALNPAVIAAMLEEGIDLRDEEPKAVSPDLLWQVDKVITLGVDLRPLSGGVRFDDWDLPESGGLQLAELRPIRDAIKGRVLTLLAEFNAPAAA